MTSVGREETDAAERDRRAERILDAAGELLVAWGYRRVTIDEVARRAGVGKGTVYLHFNTKEGLFLTVLMRSQVRLMTILLDAARDDPATIGLSRLARTLYLLVHEDPIVRAVLTADTETLGALIRKATEEMGDLLVARQEMLDGYLRLLREHGLVRDDQPLDLQRHAFMAVVAGFVSVPPMLPPGVPGVEDNAGMLADVVRSAFEVPGVTEVPAAAAAGVIDLYRGLHDRIAEEIGRRKLT